MSTSELAYFPHFIYANFIEQVLTAAKLIPHIFPNSLGTGANYSVTEGDTRLIKEEAGDKLHCISSIFTVLHKITKELHLTMR